MLDLIVCRDLILLNTAKKVKVHYYKAWIIKNGQELSKNCVQLNTLEG